MVQASMLRSVESRQPFVVAVRRALHEAGYSGREQELGIKVAVALALDLPRHRLPERIGASGAEVRAAIAALERVVPLLEREEERPRVT
jgi:hypothetical protein